MKVRDLLELLQSADPDADVLIASQPSWPFECKLEGVAFREDVQDYGADDLDEDIPEEEREPEPEDDPNANSGMDTWMNRGRSSDVILLEGRQLRYGQGSYWANPIS